MDTNGNLNNDNLNVDGLHADGTPDAYRRPDEAVVFEQYAAIIRRLRGDGGCPWDRKQTLRTLRRYIVEESFEALSAIEDLGTLADAGASGDAGSDASGDTQSPGARVRDADVPNQPAETAQATAYHHVAEELGDVVLVVLLLADALEQAAGISFAEILLENGRKLIRRHPHVFADVSAVDPDTVVANWNQIKTEQEGRPTSVAHVSAGLPPLERAYEIQKKAAKQGFDWPDIEPVFAKVHEELQELQEAVRATESGSVSPRDDRAVENELGDVIFSLVNVSRHLKADPSVALAGTNEKFLSRFLEVERGLEARGSGFDGVTLEEMDALWDAAKRGSEG